MATAITTELNNASSASFSPEETLAFLEKNGKINLRDVEDDMKKARKESILNKHPYKIYQGSDGRWRTHLPDDSKKEGRKLIVKTSYDDLVDLICQHYEAINRDLVKEACTLKDLYPLWIEYKAVHVAETTVMRVEKDWRRYYEASPIINKPIAQLTKLELDSWVHTMIREHKMDRHKFGNFSLIMRQMLEYAVDSEIVDSNEFLKVKIDKKRVLEPSRKKEDHTQVFSKEEEQQIITRAMEAFDSDEHYVQHFVPLVIAFLFYTGLRIGEVSALKYCDIDENSLTVNRMVRYPTGEIIEHTKGTYGARKVPLTPAAKSIIDKITERRKALGLSVDNYIFCPNDKPVATYTASQKTITKYCRELGIEEKSIHKVRKTMISTMIDGGLNLNTARQIAGHMDEKTTLNNYYYDRSDEAEKYDNFVKALS